MSDILKPIPFYGDKDGEVGVCKPAASGWISVETLSDLYPIVRAAWKNGELDYALWKEFNKHLGNEV